MLAVETDGAPRGLLANINQARQATTRKRSTLRKAR
jgi:hypothetical protein